LKPNSPRLQEKVDASSYKDLKVAKQHSSKEIDNADLSSSTPARFFLIIIIAFLIERSLFSMKIAIFSKFPIDLN
jgi:hypothetical protein